MLQDRDHLGGVPALYILVVGIRDLVARNVPRPKAAADAVLDRLKSAVGKLGTPHAPRTMQQIQMILAQAARDP